MNEHQALILKRIRWLNARILLRHAPDSIDLRKHLDRATNDYRHAIAAAEFALSMKRQKSWPAILRRQA